MSTSGTQVFFSLGDAVAAFGLVFAVFQLKNKSWDIVLRIRPRWQRNLIWYCSGAGLFFIAIATLSHAIPFCTHCSSIFDSSMLWEFLGFLCFIGAPLSIYHFGQKKDDLFNKKRAQVFYFIILHEITRLKADNLDACVDIITANLDSIAKALIETNNGLPIPVNSSPEEKLTDNEKYNIYAKAVTTVIFSDERFAKYIATGRLDFLFQLFSTLKKYGITERHVPLGLERIFEILFREKSSYFYSQLDWRGSTIAANAFQEIFSDPYFVSNFPVFRAVQFHSLFYQITNEYLAVYLKALECAVNGYWENNCPDNMTDEICRAFRQLNDYSNSLARATREKGKHKDAMSRLGLIGSFLGHTYIWAYMKALEKNQVSIFEKNVIKQDDFNYSINYAYAESIYKFIEAIALIKEEYPNEGRFLLITTASETISFHDHGPDVNRITDTIINLVWEKIADENNMSNLKGFFPFVLRAYIMLIGYKIESTTETTSGIERTRLIAFLYEKIKPKILSNTLMADNRTTFEKALLPTLSFDRTTGKFEYLLSNGDRQVME